MSTVTLILGESGAGKSASMRNLDPGTTLLIQTVRKPLPFKAKGWAHRPETPDGNIIVCDDWQKIIGLMQKTGRKVIVLDDTQYLLANEFMRRSDETGFGKFTDIAKHAWEVFSAAALLPADVRVYILSHTQTTDDGTTKFKTVGKMLDEKITVEGLFTIVLRAIVFDQQHLFSTRNNGRDTVKAPMGMFAEDRIENDLAVVDAAICDYYEIPNTKAPKAA